MKHIKIYEELTDFTRELFDLTSIWYVRGIIHDDIDFPELESITKKCVEIFSNYTGVKIEFLNKKRVNEGCMEYRFKIYQSVNTQWVFDNINIVSTEMEELYIGKHNRSGLELGKTQILYGAFVMPGDNISGYLPDEYVNFRADKNSDIGFYRIQFIS